MVRVRWEDLERTPTFEDMVSVLLSRQHPDAERIDGIGGDGGRDVQLRRPGRLDLFELKSFTGRLGARPNRRGQVEESLRAAAALQPDKWCLVVPIDHNTAELRWFDGLRQQYPFPLIWHGRTWLDDQMAAFQDIHRYYVEGAQHEVVELLRELNAEEASLTGGAGDAVARLDRLRNRLNDLDPQYRLELTTGPAEGATAAFPRAAMWAQRPSEHGPVTISVIPKYRDAARDRPILVKADLSFPNTELGQEAANQFVAFLNYGDPAVVDSEYIEGVDVDAPGGLGGRLGPGRLRVGPVTVSDAFMLDARLRAIDEAGAQLASLPVRFTKRHGGRRGDTIAGHDATGVVHVSIRFEETERRVKVDVHVQPSRGQLPGSLLPALRFAHALRSPHRFAATFAGRDLWTNPQPLPDLDLVPSEYLRLVEDVARIQTETNTPFPLPDEIEAEDIATLRRLVRLLDGEPLAVQAEPITVTLTAEVPRPWLMNEDEAGSLALEAQCWQRLMGEQIPLGTCNIVARGAWRVEDVVPDHTLPPGHTQVRLVPLDARAVIRRGSLIHEEDRSDGPPPGGPPASIG
jgi:hypothetical protein